MTLDYEIRVVDRFDDTTSYLARPVLLRNTGEGKFVDVTDQSGIVARGYGMGVATGDYDEEVQSAADEAIQKLN